MASGVRHALRADLPTVVDIWVDAFTRDPYLRWIQPDDERWQAFGRAWMAFVADAAFECGHTYLTDTSDAAVAWVPPDLSLLSPDAVARGRQILAEHGGEARAEAAFATILAARAHDLSSPHWTLQYLGVRASAQGAGRGAAIVAPMLGTVDREGLACGLVSSNPHNLSFYERLGFSVVGEVATPDGEVTLRPMHRLATAR